MKNQILLIILSITLLSCSSGVKYLGNSYTPTETVKIFFSPADIDKPYEVIGKVYLDVEENTKDEKIQNLILNKAKEHGGEAVIMGDLQVIRSGSVSGTSGGSTGAGKNSRIGGSAKKTKTTNNIRMEIEVIKYK